MCQLIVASLICCDGLHKAKQFTGLHARSMQNIIEMLLKTKKKWIRYPKLYLNNVKK